MVTSKAEPSSSRAWTPPKLSLMARGGILPPRAWLLVYCTRPLFWYNVAAQA